MTDKEKFRKEVEKLKSNLIYGACSSQVSMETMCKEEAYNEVLAILDTMQEESKPKFKTGDKIKPVDSCLGSPRTILDVCDSWYITDQGTLDFEYEDNWEAVEEPVSDDLEEAAEEWDESLYRSDTFKAGAKWQKEQMMKDAITARCFGFQSPDALFSIHLPAKGYLVGHELRVIIVKED